MDGHKSMLLKGFPLERLTSHGHALGLTGAGYRLFVYLVTQDVSLARTFKAARSGTAAVEFALLLPVMLVLYFGMVEFSRGFDNWRKLEAASRAISDLTSQGDTESPMRASTMNDIFASAKLIMRPFDGSSAKVRVSALGVDLVRFGLTKPKVCSSYSTSNFSPRAVGMSSDLTIPSGFQTQGARYMLVEMSTAHTPLLGSTLVNLMGGSYGSFEMRVVVPWPVRTDEEIVLPGGSKC
jgi:Flp pilus assembly protein TadG